MFVQESWYPLRPTRYNHRLTVKPVKFVSYDELQVEIVFGMDDLWYLFSEEFFGYFEQEVHITAYIMMMDEWTCEEELFSLLFLNGVDNPYFESSEMFRVILEPHEREWFREAIEELNRILYQGTEEH